MAQWGEERTAAVPLHSGILLPVGTVVVVRILRRRCSFVPAAEARRTAEAEGREGERTRLLEIAKALVSWRRVPWLAVGR